MSPKTLLLGLQVQAMTCGPDGWTAVEVPRRRHPGGEDSQSFQLSAGLGKECVPPSLQLRCNTSGLDGEKRVGESTMDTMPLEMIT